VGFFIKLKCGLKAINFLKNWKDFFLLYLGMSSDNTILNLKNNLKIKLRKNSTDVQAFANIWLLEEYRKKGFEIHSNDIIIDIGAHIGLFSLYASHFCKNGKIFSYEPVKENFDLLCQNIQLNNLQNILVFQKAVSAMSGEIRMNLNIDDDAAHSIIKKSQKSVTVNSISLKEIFDENEIDTCNLVKFDCEGAEYQILNALPNEYFSKIEKIVMECHIIDKNFNDFENLKSKLTLNFNVEARKTTDDYLLLFASKKGLKI